MKGVLNSTTVQQTIMEKALEVCSSLPKEMSPSCNDFVTTYGEIAIVYLSLRPCSMHEVFSNPNPTIPYHFHSLLRASCDPVY